MPYYLRHAFVSGKSDGSDNTLVRPSNWNANIQLGTSSAPNGTDATIREGLTANRTYYVRTDGSDSNTGLTDSAGGAFLTWQAAYDNVVSNLDLNGKTVTLQAGAQGAATTFAAGINFSQPWTGGGTVTVQGDTANLTNRVISVTTGQCFIVNCVLPGAVTIQGFRVISTTGYGIVLNNAGSIVLGDMNYGSCAASHIAAGAAGATVFDSGTSVVASGSTAQGHFEASYGGLIYVNGAYTINGTPAFSGGFARVLFQGIVDSSVVYTSAASATGTRYNADSNGTINTYGAGANYFPGSVAGSTSNDSIYV